MAENIVASSEFDPTQFLAGFKQMTSAVETFIKKEQELTATLDNQEKQLAETQKALAATKAQIDALDKSASTYGRDLAALNKQQADQRAMQRDLQNSVKATKTELEGTNKTIKEYERSFKALGLTIKQVADQSKGKNIFNVASLTQQIAQIQQAGGRLREIFGGGVDDQALQELESKLAGVTDEFEQLGTVLDFIRDKLQTLDPNTQEFEELTKVVQVGEQVLKDFGKTQEDTGKKSQSTRARLRELREELVRLEDAGQENTEQFQKLQIEAGKLSDSVSDAQERIRVLASDTKALDFGLGAIRGVAAGFSVAAGATELFGLRSEDVLQTIARLNAIMAVLNGLQEIQNLLKKQSVVLIVGQEIATKALTVSQRILAAAFGQTAAASKGLQIALISTGVGALVVVIGFLVAALKNWADAANKAAEEQADLNDNTERAIDLNERLLTGIERGTQQQIAALELLQEKSKNLTGSEAAQLRERIKNAQQLRDAELNATRDQVNATEQLENAQREAFERALRRRQFLLNLPRGLHPDEDELKALNETIDNFQNLQQKAFDLRNKLTLQELQNQRDQVRDANELRALELRQTEDFEKRLRDLQARLQDARLAPRAQNADEITRQSVIRLTRELSAITREVNKGNITSPRGEILKALLRQISGVELETELKEFNKKVADTARALEEQLTNLKLQAATQRAELIRDELTREAATIETIARQERNDLLKERDAMLREIRENVLGLDEKVVQANADKVLKVYNDLLVQLSTRTRRAQEELAAKAFEIAQEEVRRSFARIGTTLTQETTKEIIDLTERFQAGRISYEKYQKELTRIATEETQRRIGQQITEANSLLFNTRRRLDSERDPQRKKALQDEIRELEQQIAELQRQLAEGQVEQTEKGRRALAERIAVVAEYAQAIQSITNSVVSFWQSANEAERVALEKSISLQKTRVEAATRLAERGNAEYLRLEEDRLKELEIKQENAARRQLAINAVLQTSQALTAFVGALAQGIAIGGPLGGIAIAGSVLALLASGYAIIQNLQKNNVQRLYKGTRRVKRENGEPQGVDTVPAMLTEGEAVTPKDKSEAYSDTMDAVHEGTVPPQVLNNFVRQYQMRTDMPAMDYARMEIALKHSDRGLATSIHEQNTLIREQNQHLQTMQETLAGMGVDFNLDEHGFAASVGLAMKRKQILKNA